MGKKNRIVRYTYQGKTLLSVSKSSSGFVTSFIEPRKAASRNIHLTTVEIPGGLSSHITDSRRGTEQRIPVSKTNLKELEQAVNRIKPYFQRYRSNSVALRLPPILLIIMAEARVTPDAGGRQIALERWISMTKNRTLSSRKAWKKVRLTELAKAERFGLKVDRRGVFWVVAFPNGWMLKLTPRRMENFTKSLLHGIGFGFNELISYVDHLSEKASPPNTLTTAPRETPLKRPGRQFSPRERAPL
ncbi:MAG TPA: hypothetical protein VGG32_05525 [Thermoplasmata archaeon]|jgi:hypothetical protein